MREQVVAEDYRELLERSMSAAAPSIGEASAADDVPTFPSADPRAFGLALATVDGEVHGVGDWQQPFPIQSVSKAFALALTVARDGPAIWDRVGREPSGDPFNSLLQLEYDQGVPRNPFINAGALVVTDHLLSVTSDACGAVCELVRDQSGNPGIRPDPAVAAWEVEHGHRNAALAHLIASYGKLRNDVGLVLDHYFRQCAIEMSCRDLALAAVFLARHGVQRDGARLLSRSDAKRLNAVMLMCGTYDGAGDVASVGAVAALDAFTTLTGWSIF
jgi:glutaminase